MYKSMRIGAMHNVLYNEEAVHTRNGFFCIVHCNFVYSCFSSWRSLDQGLVPFGESIYLSIYLCYTHTQHVRLHHLENKKTRPNSVHNRNSTLFLLSQPYLSLQDASVSFWRATQPVCASSNPWKPGTVM